MAGKRTNIKIEPNDEWEAMFKKLRGYSNADIKMIWQALNMQYDPASYYAPGITMDSWAQAVYSEMDQRGIPHL